MKFHKDGTLPTDPDAIFVFGSNLAGIHGAGAAKVAYEKYGAEWGRGECLSGTSYAIPTKDNDIRTLPLARIAREVKLFLFQALCLRDVPFFVTRIGCGLAGYRDEDIAPMFKGCSDNCDLPEGWKEYVT
jgi:hypothetical protein